MTQGLEMKCVSAVEIRVCGCFEISQYSITAESHILFCTVTSSSVTHTQSWLLLLVQNVSIWN